MQMLYFRPHNRFGPGLYIVGGGTHPGSGLPVIYEGARISARLLIEELAGARAAAAAGIPETAPLGHLRRGLVSRGAGPDDAAAPRQAARVLLVVAGGLRPAPPPCPPRPRPCRSRSTGSSPAAATCASPCARAVSRRASCVRGDEAPASDDRALFTFQGVSPGTYAVAAYQDANGNGRLDRTGLGLPLEPYGFSGVRRAPGPAGLRRRPPSSCGNRAPPCGCASPAPCRGDEAMDDPLVRIAGVGLDLRGRRVLERVDLDLAGRRDPGAARAERGRQVLADAPRGRAGSARARDRYASAGADPYREGARAAPSAGCRRRSPSTHG